ncbi:unnamed protein product [Symbiodinium sp. KB8]|nr:unnamed protein product [Symbiodinium sp. KB8]
MHAVMQTFPQAIYCLECAAVKNTFLDFTDELGAFEELAADSWLRSESEPARCGHAAPSKESKGGEESLLLAFAPEADDNQKSMWRLHITGHCKPCRFFTTHVNGCHNGDACEYCHFCSPEAVRQDLKTAGDGLCKVVKERFPGV